MNKNDQNELIEALRDFSAPEYRKAIEAQVNIVTGIDSTMEGVIIDLTEISSRISTGNLKRAEEIYDHTFIDTGYLQAQKALSPGELQRFFDKKEKLNLILMRLRQVRAYINMACEPCVKAFGVYNKISKYADTAIRFSDRTKMRDMADSAEEYRRYFAQIGDDFSRICSTLTDISSDLPPGIKEYCTFIFAAGEASQAAFKLVDGYAEKINRLAERALDDLANVIGSNRTNPAKATQILKGSGSLNRIMDAGLGY